VESSRRDPDRPLVVVVGNCQADVYRDHLASRPELDVPPVPPVHELGPAEADRVRELVTRADALLAQPVREDYRGLPVGTRQLTALLPPAATTVLVPVLRYAGLHPYQVMVRPPADRSLVPPVVPYHDLRLLAEAAGLRVPPVPAAAALREAAAESVGALRVREEAHGTLRVSDLLERHPRWHTVNHPDRETLAEVVARIGRALPGGGDPGLADGREPLGGVRAPALPEAEDALGLDRSGRRTWTVGGREVGPDEIAEAHLRWYREHPDAVAEGLRRHRERMRMLGWT